MPPPLGSYTFPPKHLKDVGTPPKHVRRNFYLDEARKLGRTNLRIEGYTEGVILTPGMDYGAYVASLHHYPYGRHYIGTDEARRRQLYELYVEPLLELSLEAGMTHPFLVVMGDNNVPVAVPAFTKSRPAHTPGMGIIQRLEYDRHFGPLKDLAKFDVPWAEKDDRLVWRGATTGRFSVAPTWTNFSSRYHIPRVRAENHPGVDVGFSEIVQIRETEPLHAEVSAALAPRLSMADQLRAKYLLVLEGNDTASSLKWMLASNSVVVMPRPEYATWACERFLRPGVHYVPIRTDLADLVDVMAWLRANDAACQTISDNASAFMEGFVSAADDRELRLSLLEFYDARVRLKRGPHHEIGPGVF